MLPDLSAMTTDEREHIAQQELDELGIHWRKLTLKDRQQIAGALARLKNEHRVTATFLRRDQLWSVQLSHNLSPEAANALLGLSSKDVQVLDSEPRVYGFRNCLLSSKSAVRCLLRLIDLEFGTESIAPEFDTVLENARPEPELQDSTQPPQRDQNSLWIANQNTGYFALTEASAIPAPGHRYREETDSLLHQELPTGLAPHERAAYLALARYTFFRSTSIQRTRFWERMLQEFSGMNLSRYRCAIYGIKGGCPYGAWADAANAANIDLWSYIPDIEFELYSDKLRKTDASGVRKVIWPTLSI